MACDRAIVELELYVLRTIWDQTSRTSFAAGEYAFCLSAFNLPKEIARGVLRTLAAKGLVRYVRALWSEDGEPRGSGYTLTEKGAEFMLADMQHEEDFEFHAMVKINHVLNVWSKVWFFDLWFKVLPYGVSIASKDPAIQAEKLRELVKNRNDQFNGFAKR